MGRRLATSLGAIVLALHAVSGANALSLVIETDASVYAPGDTIHVTVTLDTTGAPGTSPSVVLVTLGWNGARATPLGVTPSFDHGSAPQVITAGANAGNSNLISFGGALPWYGYSPSACVRFGPGAGNTCAVLSQTNLAGAFPPDASTLVGTLELLATDVGSLDLLVDASDVFGATPTLGPNLAGGVTIAVPQIPGPGPLALVVLGGLLGAASLPGLARAAARRFPR